MQKLNILFAITIGFLCNLAYASDDPIRIGMECNYAPFNWTQTQKTDTAVALEDGISYCDGYDVAIAKIIANKLNKKLVIKTNPVFEALLTDIQMNNIDLIIAGMSDTPKRRSAVNFSNVYYQSDLVLVVQKNSKFATAKSLKDFAKAKVAAQIGTFHDDMIAQIPEAEHVPPLQSFPLLTLALSSNTIDAFVSEKPVAHSIVKSNPKLTYVNFDKNNGFNLDAEDVTVSIGIAKGKDQLRANINKILAEISQQQREEIMLQAIERQPN